MQGGRLRATFASTAVNRPATMGDKEWNRSGSFVKKPTTGWLHDDRALSVGDGVYYPVKYVGSIPLQKSMRELRFEDRTVVTRCVSCPAFVAAVWRSSRIGNPPCNLVPHEHAAPLPTWLTLRAGQRGHHARE